LTALDRGPENERAVEEGRMRWTKALGLTALAAWGAAPHAGAQAPRPSGSPSIPPTVPGYAVTLEIRALAPELKAPTHLAARVYLAEDLSSRS